MASSFYRIRYCISKARDSLSTGLKSYEAGQISGKDLFDSLWKDTFQERMTILQRIKRAEMEPTFSAKRETLLVRKIPCPRFRKYSDSRSFCSSTMASESSSNNEMISVTFVDKYGDERTIKVPIGMSMLEAAHQNGIELEGACEGSLACSTCHVIVMDEEYYKKLAEPTDEENDMLDLAFGLTETSRLGCQVIAKRELDGMRLALPSATRNFAVDGFVPKPH